MDSKLNTIEEANNDKLVVNLPRKAKKAEKKMVVTGKASMVPPHWEHQGPLQTLSEALNAHDFSQSGARLPRKKTPGPNASCSTTYRGIKPALSQLYGTFPTLATRNMRMTRTTTLGQRNSLRTLILTEVSTPFTGTGVMTTLRFPSATTRPNLTCPTLASWYHGITKKPAPSMSCL
jgi:hypothetical protein